MKQDDIFIEAYGKLGAFDLDVAFHAPLRGVTTLFGPSGCGKTSVLRAIAGLNRLVGTIRIGDEKWQDKDFFLPPHKRALGYVFQEASLFAHLSVRANLTFAMQTEGHIDFDDIIALLNLQHLIERYPHHLSGGERQRVAIGRALLSNPQVLLMDEPLSALDGQLREEIMPFLLRLRQHLAIPIFYISHDMREVERLADYMVMMDAGRIIATGSLQQLQADPSLPLSHAAEATVSLEAWTRDWDKTTGLAIFDVAGGVLRAPMPMRPEQPHIRLKIAASDVSLTLEMPESSSILNVLPVQILSATVLEQYEMLLQLALDGERPAGKEGAVILSRISLFSWQALHLHQGQRVYAQIKGVTILPKIN